MMILVWALGILMTLFLLGLGLAYWALTIYCRKAPLGGWEDEED